MNPFRRAKILNPGFHEFLLEKGSVPVTKRLCYIRQMQRLHALRSDRNSSSRDAIPVILSRHEALRIINQLEGTARLIAGIMYGSGLRLQECLTLRIKDLDFELGCLTVGSDRIMKKRQTILAESLKDDLQMHLFRVRALYEEGHRSGMQRIAIPAKVERDTPEAAQEWGWFWLFPEQHTDMGSRRHHLSASVIETEISQAIRAAGTSSGATVRTLRDSFANHLIESGCDIQTVEELLGLSENGGALSPHTRPLSIRSPLD